MTGKEMLEEILMRASAIAGIRVVEAAAKLFFVITAPDTSRTHRVRFRPMIHAMNRAEAGATKTTDYTDKLIDLIPIGGFLVKRAHKKGACALAERELGKKLYHIGGTPK